MPNWSRYNVRTLHPDDLRKASEELLSLARRNFTPDLLIGVRSGGYIVAELMMDVAPQGCGLLPITCRRPSTGGKNKFAFIKRMLQSLPAFITDRLRILEHILLTRPRKPDSGLFTPDAGELAAIKAYLDAHPQSRVLVVDDSVDSGATLAAVVAIIRNTASGGAAVKTAAITVTTESPAIQPDFSLYRYVLCRFPWSLDFKR
jgi:hypothetical protein